MIFAVDLALVFVHYIVQSFPIENIPYIEPKMATDFKKVPALQKGFLILDHLAREKEPQGISRIASALGLHKSTVFNIVHTLTELEVLTCRDSRFSLGTKIYSLARTDRNGTDLISTIRPFLANISLRTRLSTFLGMRTGDRAIILDKVDSPVDLKISTDVGLQVPLLAGAGGKVLAAQLDDLELGKLLNNGPLPAYTPNTCTDPRAMRRIIEETRRQGHAFDREEYLEGIKAVAVPVDTGQPERKVAIWAIGLAGQMSEEVMLEHAETMKSEVTKAEDMFFP